MKFCVLNLVDAIQKYFLMPVEQMGSKDNLEVICASFATVTSLM